MYFIVSLLFATSSIVVHSTVSPQQTQYGKYENRNSRDMLNFPEFIGEIGHQIKKGVGGIRDKIPWVSGLIPGGPSQDYGRQFQQWQVALVLPPSLAELKAPNPAPGSSTEQSPMTQDPIAMPQTPSETPEVTLLFPGAQSESGVSNQALPLQNEKEKGALLLGGLNLNDVSQKPIKLEDDLPTTGTLKLSCQRARGQYPSPTSCSRFLNCWDEAVVEQDCPEGLLFSRRGYCDYPDNVECSRRPIMLREQKCLEPYATFRDQLNCSRFFVCVAGSPIKFECPDALKYNQELGVCDYPSRIACTDRITASFDINAGGISASVGSASKDFIRTYSGNWQPFPTMQGETLHVMPGLIDTGVRCSGRSIQPIQSACSSVAICRDGYSQIVNCPRGTAFDSHAMKCIFENAAQC